MNEDLKLVIKDVEKRMKQAINVARESCLVSEREERLQLWWKIWKSIIMEQL